ncbi:MAG: DUF1648 domain-containing protein [Terriglobia bacterium]
MLRLISLILLAYSYFVIQSNLSKLPARMPTHFNAAGVADGWGSPDILWVLFGAQVLTCVIFLIVPYIGQRFPGTIHFGSRRINDFPPAQRAKVIPLLNDMAEYMSIVMNLFFILLLQEIIQAATQPIPRIHPLLPLVLLVGGMLGVMVYYLRRIGHLAKNADG